MSTATPIAPYRRIALQDGSTVPFYILRFDKDGGLESPRTRDHALAELATGAYSDVFVFSHGWNNDWAATTARYDGFVDGFAGLVRERGAATLTRDFRPLLIGIFWPSAILVAPGEQAPLIAALGATIQAGPAGDDVEEIAEALPAAAVERFRALASAHEGLDAGAARELAEILAPLHAGADEERGDPAAAPTADELLRVWRRLAPANDAAPAASEPQEWGTVGGGGEGPMAAGLLDRLNPRNILRATTVRMMKDRAGVVGARGVSALIGDVLRAGSARLHLVGHSYGARVCLSAVAAARPPRAVDSMLLLQPAVNHLCFADRVDGRDRPGGYRRVPAAVTQPILTTFSRHDEPLTRFFHLGLTRDADLGEPQIAAWPEPPSPYAALGGYGPLGASASRVVALADPGTPYPLDEPGTEILAIDASRGIGGHSDISNRFTWWALLAQVAGA